MGGFLDNAGRSGQPRRQLIGPIRPIWLLRTSSLQSGREFDFSHVRRLELIRDSLGGHPLAERGVTTYPSH